MFTVLAGGVGAARFLEGLVQVVPQEEITVIVNTGDDLELFGLRICPDIDIVTYTLAGVVDQERGWGIEGDSFACLEALARFGHPTWFRLGDRDLATCLHRTWLLRQGRSLSQATAAIARSFGLALSLLPMSDDPVATRVMTDEGLLDFQDYFVRRGWQVPVRGILFQGIEEARPAPGVLEAIRGAGGVIIAPSNPLVSIGPILALKGVREALRATPAPVAAISPIVGGRALKGPAALMLEGLGLEVSALTIARLYRDFLDIMVIDREDEGLAGEVEALGLQVAVVDTIMRGKEEKRALAQAVVEALRGWSGR